MRRSKGSSSSGSENGDAGLRLGNGTASCSSTALSFDVESVPYASDDIDTLRPMVRGLYMYMVCSIDGRAINTKTDMSVSVGVAYKFVTNSTAYTGNRFSARASERSEFLTI